MDVHRHRHVVTVVLHDLGDFVRQQAVPVVGFGHLIELGQQPQRAPLLDIRPLDLRRGGRVAGNGAGLEHGHGRGAATTGHGVVFPDKAVFLHLGLEGFNSLGFATGSPPVQDFDSTGIGGHGAQRQQGGERNNSGEAIDRIHGAEPFLVVMQVQVVVLALASESNQALEGPR
ncbi:hypothetical protein D3C77_319840 [compost metagenome]